MNQREMELASNFELQRRYEYLARPSFDNEEWAEKEMFLIDAEIERREEQRRMDEERYEETPSLDDPWFAHP